MRLYLDTNVLIRAFESGDELARALRDFLQWLERNPGRAVTSELTLAELLAPQGDGGTDPMLRRLVYQRLMWGDAVKLEAVSRDILLATVETRSRLRLKLADAIHVTTALRAGCDTMLSFDRDMMRIPPPLAHLVPTPLDLAALMKDGL